MKNLNNSFKKIFDLISLYGLVTALDLFIILIIYNPNTSWSRTLEVITIIVLVLFQFVIILHHFMKNKGNINPGYIELLLIPFVFSCMLLLVSFFKSVTLFISIQSLMLMFSIIVTRTVLMFLTKTEMRTKYRQIMKMPLSSIFIMSLVIYVLLLSVELDVSNLLSYIILYSCGIILLSIIFKDLLIISSMMSKKTSTIIVLIFVALVNIQVLLFMNLTSFIALLVIDIMLFIVMRNTKNKQISVDHNLVLDSMIVLLLMFASISILVKTFGDEISLSRIAYEFKEILFIQFYVMILYILKSMKVTYKALD